VVDGKQELSGITPTTVAGTRLSCTVRPMTEDPH
jgi:hypothetical protein